MNASQSRAAAEKIRQHFGARIAAACRGSLVPEHLLAGLIYNECGRYSSSHPLVKAGKIRAGDYNEDASRFEPGVYEDLISLRDRGFCYLGAKRSTSYSGLRPADLQGASDDAVRNLSRSFGATQIMGWSMVRMLPGTIADLRDPQKHLFLAVQRLVIVADEELRTLNGRIDPAGSFGDTLRIWNTGREKGKTYHADYVPNAVAVAEAFRQLPAIPLSMLSGVGAAFSTLSITEDPTAVDEVVADAIRKPPEDHDFVGGEADETRAAGETAERGDSADPGKAAALPSSEPPAEPKPTATVVVEQAKPAADPIAAPSMQERLESAGRQIKAWHMAVPGGILGAAASIWKMIVGAPALLIGGILGCTTLIVCTFIGFSFWYSNQKKQLEEGQRQREYDLKLQREKQAHEITILQAKSAMDQNAFTVKVLPQPLRNSDQRP